MPLRICLRGEDSDGGLAVLAMKYEIPPMLETGGGSIVNMASTAGLHPVARGASASASPTTPGRAAGRLAAQLGRVVRAADEAGLDTVWVADHLIQADPNSTPDAEMLEAYTTLGFLAAQTERVRLGTKVTGVTYRPPALLVKAVTTLDVLSGGRAWLGVGAGYHEDEARAMGLPLPPVTERFERLEETLRLALQMWSGDDSTGPWTEDAVATLAAVVPALQET